MSAQEKRLGALLKTSLLCSNLAGIGVVIMSDDVRIFNSHSGNQHLLAGFPGGSSATFISHVR